VLTPKLLTTLLDYDVRTALADMLAGITVAMVALPLSIAIAIASGASPAQGLVTAIIGGFLVSALGGSRVQIGGPTGAFIVVVAGIITTFGYSGLVTATLMAGVILVGAALLRAGRLAVYVPEAVVNGFTIGIGVIIATSQIKDLFGLTLDQTPDGVRQTLIALWQARATIRPDAVIVGGITIALIVILRRAAPRWPGLIVAVAAGSALGVWLADVDTVGSRFGALPSTLPLPMLPDLTLSVMLRLIPAAFTIAFLAGIESLLSAMVADRMIGGSHRPNAELMAQGVANLGSALFGGLPVTGAIARTATNVRSGGKTPMAGIVHALVIFVIMLVAAPLAGRLAMPSLAGLLMVTAWNMSEPHKWQGYLRARPADRVLLITTLVLTVLIDLTTAIGVGVALGLLIRWRDRGNAPRSLPGEGD
jgi:sulfate permease, SulP family